MMKERDIFQNLRKRNYKLSLRTQQTLFIGAVALTSILIAYGITVLFETLFPVLEKIPILVEVLILSFLIAIVMAHFITRIFSKPIQKLREGMGKVADGDFSVRLPIDTPIGEMQELFAGFNMMVQELQSTEILQSDFISNVSHEFKTPINAIEGYTTLLQGTDNIDETENAYIEKILFSTRRLSSLVNDILLLSKVENQTIDNGKTEFALDEQIREAIVVSESDWSKKDIELDVEMDDIRYYGNEKLLYHVWTNLLSNAIKFSPDGGTIIIRLNQKEEKIYFTIDDEGPGLSDDTKKHLFDKFYQGDSSHKQEGNGLGLALVKQILTASDGYIYAENLPEKGCRFTVVLETQPQ